MLRGILELWEIEPDVILDPEEIQLNGLSKYMLLLEPILKNLTPNLVLVQGDTYTAAAAALVSHNLGIHVGHVEAGLRSGDIWNPWPEESNRKIIDSVASLHFAPTELAAENLRKEGYLDSTHLTGNTVVDAVQFVSKILSSQKEVLRNLESTLGFPLSSDFVLFTQHRRESFGEGQLNIFEAIKALGALDNRIVFPVHQNPQVKSNAEKFFRGAKNIFLIEPQEYLQFLALVKFSKLIISDSGGLQEEAPSFGKNIIITRTTTERPEVIKAGYGVLAGFDSRVILKTALESLRSEKQTRSNPFGSGNSAEKIANVLVDFLKFSK
jgi:UDP-N-acetylglucosamine 2-epimerase